MSVARSAGGITLTENAAIETRNLGFGYSKDKRSISNVSLTLYKGETAVLTGPNGAGKTTLGKLLTGILKPQVGVVRLFGEDIRKMPLACIGQKVGYVFQNPEHQLLAASVEDEIGFGLKYRGIDRSKIDQTTESLMTLFEIEHLRKQFPLNLSWGEKRRVVLAACLALEPEYLILDEPTVGLDEERIDILGQALAKVREKGIGMLLISHKRSFILDNAQRVISIERGRTVDDRYQ